MPYLAAAALGLVAGALSGAFGIGGGVVLVPALSFLFGFGGLDAVGTSLLAIIPTALIGATRYVRAGESRVADGLRVGLAGALTAPLGALAADRAGPTVVLAVFAIVVIYAAAHVLLEARRAKPDTGGRLATDVPVGGPPIAFGVALPVGGFAGFLSGFLGLGGGFLIVPLLTRFAGVSVKRAIGTSLLAVALLAVPGAISHLALGNGDWRTAFVLAVGMVPGALVGARITLGARERSVRMAFGAMLMLVGAALFAQQVLGRGA